MELSKMACSRGAPMGRREHHAHGVEGIVFELEWVPFVDGCYDYGGAYWGLPDNLYCAEAQGETEVTLFLRADSREAAMAAVLEDYPASIFRPENGSLIKATINFLEDYKASISVEDESIAEATGDEISDLESLLEEKGLT